MMNIKTLLREPLLHFLLLGAGLFLLYGQLNEGEKQIPSRITITQTDLDRLAETWLRRTGRFPSEQEKQAQLQAYIREQVLYREARQLGLDQNDIIVRRRLAQKMEFLFKDLIFIGEPDEATLQAFMQDNAEQFTRPASLSFSQVRVDPGRHAGQARQHAGKLLERLRSGPLKTPLAQLGDPLMLPAKQVQLSEQQIAALFGEAFARDLMTLPVGQWQGPVESAYGLHLVRIDEHRKAVMPALASIKDRVEREWRATEQRKANAAFYQGLRQRYDVVLDIKADDPTRLSAR